jgi:hypothetical protein
MANHKTANSANSFRFCSRANGLAVDSMRDSGEFFGCGLDSAVFCGFRAIPFGVAWFILIADAIFYHVKA